MNDLAAVGPLLRLVAGDREHVTGEIRKCVRSRQRFDHLAIEAVEFLVIRGHPLGSLDVPVDDRLLGHRGGVLLRKPTQTDRGRALPWHGLAALAARVEGRRMTGDGWYVETPTRAAQAFLP